MVGGRPRFDRISLGAHFTPSAAVQTRRAALSTTSAAVASPTPAAPSSSRRSLRAGRRHFSSRRHAAGGPARRARTRRRARLRGTWSPDGRANVSRDRPCAGAGRIDGGRCHRKTPRGAACRGGGGGIIESRLSPSVVLTCGRTVPPRPQPPAWAEVAATAAVLADAERVTVTQQGGPRARRCPGASSGLLMPLKSGRAARAPPARPPTHPKECKVGGGIYAEKVAHWLVPGRTAASLGRSRQRGCATREFRRSGAWWSCPALEFAPQERPFLGLLCRQACRSSDGCWTGVLQRPRDAARCQAR